MSDAPNSYPTPSDISMFMRSFDYEWSNEAQVFYHRNYELQTLSDKTARHLYKKLIGDEAYEAQS